MSGGTQPWHPKKWGPHGRGRSDRHHAPRAVEAGPSVSLVTHKQGRDCPAHVRLHAGLHGAWVLPVSCILATSLGSAAGQGPHSRLPAWDPVTNQNPNAIRDPHYLLP